jgi:hypothetical protein
VLCAGSTLLLVQSKALDEAPNKLSGAVAKLADITFSSLAFSYWIDKPWFLTKGKTCYCAHHTFPLGFPTGWLSCPHQAIFLAPLPGKKKTSAKGVLHAYPLLYFSFALLYFYLHHFYQKHKKISFFYSCYFITLSSLCCSLSMFWRTSQ